MADPTAPERHDPFAEFRPLWAELDENRKACATALAVDDWQTWAEHAGRGAEIFEELARLSGWRDGSDRG